MPKLLLFAACERVIIDLRENTASLIGLVETINIEIPLSIQEQIPAEVRLPINWDILALWQKLPDESDKKFEQQILLINPGGESVLAATSPVNFEPDKIRQRNITRVMGFPVVPPGEYMLKLLVRGEGQEEAWGEVAIYPVLVSRSEQ